MLESSLMAKSVVFTCSSIKLGDHAAVPTTRSTDTESPIEPVTVSVCLTFLARLLARQAATEMLRAVSVGPMASGAEFSVVFLSVCKRRDGSLILRLLQGSPPEYDDQEGRATDEGLPVVGQNAEISRCLEYYCSEWAFPTAALWSFPAPGSSEAHRSRTAKLFSQIAT